MMKGGKAIGALNFCGARAPDSQFQLEITVPQ
ncbi:MAG: hypothetical protein ACJAYE_000518 [Candidatus Azotimanducaceae bacterium]|jgi:hypothetical protein